MRIAIISDIHGNLEALTSVLEDIERRAVDEIVCLGDIVGYGPDPSACLALIADRGIASLMGNHDQAAFDVDLRTTFSHLARKAIEWTAGRLSNGELDRLRSFPLREDRNDCALVHAAPREPERYDYILDDVDAARQFSSFNAPVCFVGHTHQPEIFCEDLGPRILKPGRRCIINVGSVGQPRDGDARSCYGLFDTEAFTFEHRRIAYDIPTTTAKIYDVGLPRELGERLVLGI